MAWSSLRRTPLRRVNPERRAKLREIQFGTHGPRIEALRCAVCAALPRVEPAHVKSCGAGGEWRDIVPLCARCHRFDQHQRGIKTFQREHGVDLVELAELLASVADQPKTACSAEDLTRRLLKIPPEMRIPMLHACPVRIPKPISTGRVRDLAEWLVEWQGAHEVGRTLDLWEALETWRTERQP